MRKDEELKIKELRKKGIYIISEDEINGEQRAFLNTFYRERLSGKTNALWQSSLKELSKNDKAMYMAVKMKDEENNNFGYTILSLPTQSLSRFVRLPDSEDYTCIMYLDDVVRFSLPKIFAGLSYCDYKAWAFKFSKQSLIYDAEMPNDVLRHVQERFDIDKKDTLIAIGRFHSHKEILEILNI